MPGDNRDQHGRFAQGNRGGPGNPYGRVYADFSRRLMEIVSPEDVAEIAMTLVTSAKSGDIPSAKIVLEYLVKKAPAISEVTMETRGIDFSKPLCELTRNELHERMEHLLVEQVRLGKMSIDDAAERLHRHVNPPERTLEELRARKAVLLASLNKALPDSKDEDA